MEQLNKRLAAVDTQEAPQLDKLHGGSARGWLVEHAGTTGIYGGQGKGVRERRHHGANGKPWKETTRCKVDRRRKDGARESAVFRLVSKMLLLLLLLKNTSYNIEVLLEPKASISPFPLPPTSSAPATATPSIWVRPFVSIYTRRNKNDPDSPVHPTGHDRKHILIDKGSSKGNHR